MGLEGPKGRRCWVRARSGIATTEPGVRLGAKSQQMEPVFLEPGADMVSGQKLVRLDCISRNPHNPNIFSRIKGCFSWKRTSGEMEYEGTGYPSLPLAYNGSGNVLGT